MGGVNLLILQSFRGSSLFVLYSVRSVRESTRASNTGLLSRDPHKSTDTIEKTLR